MFFNHRDERASSTREASQHAADASPVNGSQRPEASASWSPNMDASEGECRSDDVLAKDAFFWGNRF